MQQGKSLQYNQSIAGQIFELGFKLGAIYEFELYGFARESVREKKESILEKLKTIDANTYGETIYNLAKKDLLIKNNNRSFGDLWQDAFQDSNVWKNEDSAIYCIGWYHGKSFAREIMRVRDKRQKDSQYKDSKFQLIRFDIKDEEVGKGNYHNADIILLEQTKKAYHLYVYDIKANGGYNIVANMLNEEPTYIKLPPQPYGVNVYLSLGHGQDSFESFIDKTIEFVEKQREKDDESLLLIHDFKHLLQVCSYMFDYLSKEKKIAQNVKHVSFGIISGFYDHSIYNFLIDDISKIDIDKYANKFKDLYSQAKPRRTTTSYIYETMRSYNESPIINATTIECLTQITTEKINELNKYIDNMNKNNKEIVFRPPITIDSLRKEVRNIVEERFNVFKNSKQNMVVALLHSAGAGKTTACRETILGQNEIPFVYLYIAPRTKLILEEQARVARMSNYENIDDITDGVKKNKDAKSTNTTLGVDGKSHDYYADNKNSEGNIKNGVKELLNYDFSQKPRKHVFLGLTTQSIVDNQFDQPTAEYLEKLFKQDLEKAEGRIYKYGYRMAIVLDEALGSENGMHAIDDITRVMNSVTTFMYSVPEKERSNIIFFVLDANLHSGLVFEKVLRQFEKLHYVAPSLYTTEFEEKLTFQHSFTYRNIDIYAYSNFSYPAKSLKYTCRYVDRQEDLLTTIRKEIESTIRRKEKVFIYVQDKTLVYKIYKEIQSIKEPNKEIDKEIGNEKYIKVGFYSSTAESEKENNFNQYNVIISTSTLSRGIDLSDNWTKTIIVDNLENMFNTVEQQLVEEIQAIARMRGMKDENNNSIDNEVDKEVIKILYIDAKVHKNKYEKLTSDRLISLQDEIESKDRKAIEKLFILDNEYNLKQFVRELNEITKKVLLSFISPKTRKQLIVPIPYQVTKKYIPNKIQPIINLIEDLKRIQHLIRTSDEQLEIENYRQALIELFTLYTDINDSDKDNEIGYGIFKAFINASVDKTKWEEIKAGKEKIRKILLRNNADDLAHNLDEIIGKNTEIFETYVNTYIYIPLYALQKENIVQHEIKIQRLHSLGKSKIKSLIPDKIETEIKTKNNKEGLITFTFPLAEGANLQIDMMSFPTIPLGIVNLIL